MSSYDDIVESDIELDDSDVVEPDNDPPAEMGDPSVDTTEENKKGAQELKSRAMDAFLAGKLDKAIDCLTKAIILNPKLAILFASRAIVFFKLKKPNAAIRDADAALQVDPDLAKGYKARGMAKAQLGLWEEADRDLEMASKLDFDEETSMMLKKVKPNALKIMLHHEKYKVLRLQKELEQLQTKSKEEDEAASVLKDGEVIMINSAGELQEKLDAAKKTSRLAIVYFTATWCGPCAYIAPMFSSLARKYPKAVFLKVDIDEATDATIEWKVSSIPSFFFVKNGEEVERYVEVNRNLIRTKIVQHAG